MTARSKQSRLETVAARMLDATEEIHAGLLGGGDLDLISQAYDLREVLFEELEKAIRAGARLGPVGRAQIDRVRALDAEILSLGKQQSEEILGERHGLQRRRSAIAAHASREREQPRLITLKA